MPADAQLDGYDAIVAWDMHGTLEVGNKAAVIAVSNAVLEEMGLDVRLGQEECDEWYGLKWFQYFQRLLPCYSHETHMVIQERCFAYSEQHFDDVVVPCLSPTPYSHWVLGQLEQRRCLNVLISNTQPQGVVKYRAAVGVDRYFPDPFAIAVSNHHPDVPATKEDALRAIIVEHGLEGLPIFSVGDSPGDVDLARHFGGKGILYAHDRQSMRQCKADFQCIDMRAVLGYILNEMGTQDQKRR